MGIWDSQQTVSGGGGTGDLVLGETGTTAYRGDRGKASYDHALIIHNKALVGLANVDNTSDLNKPISTATQSALDLKALANHNHDTAYEPIITSKGTAFNKSYGTGGDNVAYGNHSHIDLHTHANKAYLDTITSGSATTEILVSFSFGDATPITLFTCLAGKAVFSVQIAITEVFNGLAADLRVGDSGNNERLMSTTKNNPAVIDVYASTPAYIYLTDTEIKLWIAPGAGATRGIA